MKGYDQRVTEPDNWLTQVPLDIDFDNRQFVKVIHLPEGLSWAECTTEEKEVWESLNPQPEPDETI